MQVARSNAIGGRRSTAARLVVPVAFAFDTVAAVVAAVAAAVTLLPRGYRWRCGRIRCGRRKRTRRYRQQRRTLMMLQLVDTVAAVAIVVAIPGANQ